MQPNTFVTSSEAVTTTINALASDPDGDPLTYRWLEGDSVLLASSPVGLNGEANLPLSQIQELSVGDHQLTLEVRDETSATQATMTLSIGNSPPIATVNGGGTIQIGSSITVPGMASDYDGDSLNYAWLEGNSIITSGIIDSVKGGTPVTVPSVLLQGLSLGEHKITLEISDGVNPPAMAFAVVNVVDTQAPTLTPTASTTLLWPPNHKIVNVAINANATDNSGGQIVLNVTVSSSELPDQAGDGTTIPDIVGPTIDQQTGVITVGLRSERSGSGNGRNYTIVITATDESGNTSQATIDVKAPHDRGTK